MSLTGWQGVACLLIAAGVAVVGVLVPNGTMLVALASSMVTGVFALLQPRRDPGARTRTSDRVPTAAVGVPIYDPHRTPREPVAVPPEARRRP